MIKNIIVISLFLSFSACTTGRIGYNATVDSINDPALLEKKRYILLPGNENIKPEDLQFREYANYINRALSNRGYKRVDNPDDAELIVFAFYGISDPKTFSYIYSYPVFGKVAGGKTDYSFTTFGKSGSVSTFGTATTPNQYGVVGTGVGTSYKVLYYRYLNLDAVDFGAYKKTEKFISAWKTMVTSGGESGDLRVVFPALATAAKRWLGTNTKQQISVFVGEDDPDFIDMRYANEPLVAESTPMAVSSSKDACDYYYCFPDLTPEQQKKAFAVLVQAKKVDKISAISKIAQAKVKYCHPENTPSAYIAPEEKLYGAEPEFLEYLCKEGFLK